MVTFLKDYGECTGPLDFPMTTDDARELEKQLETGNWSPIKLEKANAFESCLVGERSDISVINDASVDADGEVVDPKSLNWDRFKRNPVVAFNHNYTIPPIGKSLWQKLCTGGIWKAKTQYISRPDSLPSDAVWFPDSIFHMIKSGALKGKSIGGAAEYREVTKEDIEQNPEYSKAKRITKTVNVFEYSVGVIGINKNTVVEQVSKALIHIPEEILLKDFACVPELLEALKDLKVTGSPSPVIKSYRTSKSYLKEQQSIADAKVETLRNQVPELVEDSFKRFLGKVG